MLKQNDVECSSTQRLNLQRAAALPVALHERLNSSTQRLNLPALAHQWRPREELQVVVVVALLPSSPSERVWLAAAGLYSRKVLSKTTVVSTSQLQPHLNTII